MASCMCKILVHVVDHGHITVIASRRAALPDAVWPAVAKRGVPLIHVSASGRPNFLRQARRSMNSKLALQTRVVNLEFRIT